MTDVFISYSRQNGDFVRRLYDSLDRSGREVWIDWESIPRGEEFLKTIYDGIDAADVFLFVASRHSLVSEICNLEIRHARRRQKKIIPIVVELIEGDTFNAVVAGWFKKAWENDARENWDVLKAINWAIFTPDRDFDTEFQALTDEIDTDHPHVRLHTRYLVAAKDWNAAGRTPSLLLIGDQVIAAEGWLQQADEKIPAPTSEQLEYIVESRRAEDERVRLAAEQEQRTRALEFQTQAAAAENARLARRTRIFRSTALFAALIGVSALVVALASANRAAEANTEVAHAQATLTQVPPTLTRVAEAIAQGEARIASLDLTSYATDLLSLPNGNVQTAALLAIRALQHGETIQAHRALNVAVDRNYAVRRLDSGASAMLDVAYSPDGHLIVTADGASGASLWNADTGELLRQFNGHSDAVLSAAFNPDGRFVVTASSDTTAILWDVATGQQIRTFESVHTFSINSVTFSPDGQLLVTGGSDMTVVIWDVATGEVLHILTQRDWVRSVHFSPDGSRLASVSGSIIGTVYIWDAHTWEKIHQWDIPYTSGTDAVYSPDGTLIATAGETVILWDAQTFEQVREFPREHNIRIKSVSFSADGQYLVTAGDDDLAILWYLSQARAIRRFSGHMPTQYSGVSRAVFSPDGNLVVTSSYDGTAIIWDADATREQVRDNQGDVVLDAVYSPDGLHFAASYLLDTVVIWDYLTNTRVHTLVVPDTFRDNSLSSLAYSPDGTMLLTAVGNSVLLWDTSTGALLRSLQGEASAAIRADFDPTGHFIAVTQTNSIEVWDAETGTEIERFTSGGDEVWTDVHYSPDGEQIMGISMSNTVVIWDSQSREVMQRWHDDRFVDLTALHAVYSPQGSEIAAARGTTVLVWDVNTGEERLALVGITSTIVDIEYSPDGRFLLTSSADGVGNIWDTRTGERVRTLNSDFMVALGGTYSPDGSQMMTYAFGMIHFWDVSMSDVISFACGGITRPDLTEQERVEYAIFNADGTLDESPTCPE